MNEELLQLAYSKFETDADYETFKADLLQNEDLQRLAYAKFDTTADFDTFRVDLLGEKKNLIESEPSGELPTEDTTSDFADLPEVDSPLVSEEKVEPEPEKRQSVLGKMFPSLFPDDGEKFDPMDTEAGKAFESGALRLESGFKGIPKQMGQSAYAMAMSAAKVFFGDAAEELDKKIQSLPEEERTQAIIDMLPVKLARDIMEGSASAEKESIEAKEKLDDTRKQYEGNIVDDIGKGDFLQAGERIALGAIESAPMMAIIMGTGGAGLAAIGTSTAVEKSTSLQREGEDVDLATQGVAAARGLAEVVGGKLLQGIFKPVEGVAREGAKEIAKAFVERTAKGMATEFLEESSQTLQETFTDAIVLGKDFEWGKLWKDAVDAGLIGAFSTSASGVQGTVADIAASTTTPEGATVPLDIPAVEDTVEGVDVEAPITKEQYLAEQEYFQENSPFAWSVDPVTEADLETSDIVEHKGTMGVVSKDGDIKGLFNPSVQKAADAKPKDVIYTAEVVDDTETLKTKYPPVHPNEFYHHSTNEFKPEDKDVKDTGKKGEIKVVGRLTTEKVDVLIVENENSKNETPHITLSTAEGVKPFASNKEIAENQDKIVPVEDAIQVTKGFHDGQNVITEPAPVPEKGTLRGLIPKLIKAGGKKLDNYDGKLTELYEEQGFRVTSKTPFNAEYAREGYDTKNPPEFVVAMVYDPNGEMDIEEQTFEDYDDMIEYRDSFLAESDTNQAGQTLDEVMANVSKKNQKAVRANVKKSLAALETIAPDVKIKVFRSNKSFDKAAGRENSAAYYDPKTKTIGVNINRADGTTVGHEAFHAILLETLKTDVEVQAATKRMVEALQGTLSAEQNAVLDAFIENYAPSIRNEEKVAELMGILADNYQQLPVPKQNIIKKWLQRLAKRFGLKTVTDTDVVNMLNTIARKLSIGETITEQDVEALTSTKVNTEFAQPNETTRYSKVMDALQKEELPVNPNTIIRKDVSLSEIDGQNVSSTLSDKLFAGVMGDFKFLGGVGYPQVTGRFWAADAKGSANKIVNESKKSKDGYRYLLPAIMSNTSHVSNKNSTIIAVMLLKEAHANGEFTAEQMRNQLRKTFKSTSKESPLIKYLPKIEVITKTDNVNQMMDDLQNLMVSELTFDERKKAVRSIIGQGMKAKYPTVGTVAQFAKSIEEPLTKSAGLHDVVSVIRTKGNLKVVETPKKDEFYHESYGFHVESDQEVEVLYLDGAYPLVDIIPEFKKESDGVVTSLLNEVQTKLGKTKSGKVKWTVDNIRKNLGRTHGLASYSAVVQSGIVSESLEKRFQEDKALENIIREGKNEGFTNEQIRKFLEEKGYDTKEIDAGLRVTKSNREMLDLEQEITEAVNRNIRNNKDNDSAIINEYKGTKNQEVVKGYVLRARGMTSTEAYKQHKDSWAKAIKDQKKAQAKEKGWKAVKKAFFEAATAVWDRQAIPKTLMDNAGFENAVDFMVVGAGASSYAKNEFDKIYEKVYSGKLKDGNGLNDKMLDLLDQVIHLERIVAVDKNRKERGLHNVLHQGNSNTEAAQQVLDEIKKEIGVKDFAELQRRAKDYFDAYKNILKEMNTEGILSDFTYDQFRDVNYQPREYLKHMEDIDGQFLVEELRQREGIPLSGEQIKSMKIGSTTSQITDSKYLIQRTLLTRAAAVFANRLNNTFAAEFKKQEEHVKTLRAKEFRTKAEWKVIDNFELIKSKVTFDEILKFNKKGQPKYKLEKQNTKGKKPIYYYENGVANRIYLEESFHSQFTDTQEQLMNANVKEGMSLITGQAFVTAIATGNNPAFFITNMPRDFMFTLAFSPEYGTEVLSNTIKLAGDLTKGMGQALTNGKDYQLYLKYGGGMEFLALQGKFKDRKGIRKTMVDAAMNQKTQDIIPKVLGKKVADRWNLASEMGMRVAVFNRSIKNQLKEANVSDISTLSEADRTLVYTKAVRSARELTDFSQGGRTFKLLNSAVPYLNAATQGTRAAAIQFGKRPTETTARVVQLAAYSSTAMILSSFALMSMFKDDQDDEVKAMTKGELYLATIETVSEYDLQNYFIIPLGFKDDKGNYRYLRVAKAQAVSPLINVTEHALRTGIAKSVGGGYQGDVVKIGSDTFMKNVSPVDLGLYKRIPLTSMTLAFMGINAYTEQPLSFDRGTIDAQNEGIVSDKVEDFYKILGEETGKSPLRLKAAMESFVTTPTTNPLIGGGYLLANSLVGSDEGLGQSGLSKIGRATMKRLYKSGSPYNVIAKSKKRATAEIVKIEAKLIRMKKEVKDMAKKVKAGDGTAKEIIAVIEKTYKTDPMLVEKAVATFKNEIAKNPLPPMVIGLKYERNKEKRAQIMFEHYGNSLMDGLDQKERDILKQLKDEGAVDEETMQYYFRLFE